MTTVYSCTNLIKLKSLFGWLNALILRTSGSNLKNIFVLGSLFTEEGYMTLHYGKRDSSGR